MSSGRVITVAYSLLRRKAVSTRSSSHEKEKLLRAGEEPSDLVVVADENRDAHVAFVSDDDA
jgi:hypothetical protein